jgi:2-iminobutanoate/2-iminopropanoate deaminase
MADLKVVHVPGPNLMDLPISRGVITGNLVFVSGHGGFTPGTTDAPPGVEAQTELCLNEVRAVLEAAGTDLGHVVKVNVYLTDPADFAAMNKVFRRYFPKDPPARTTVGITLMRPDMLVEIEAIAALPSRSK